MVELGSRNLCTESGCKAFCCLNVTRMHFKELSKEQLLTYWPEAVDARLYTSRETAKRDGVYYREEENGFTVKIVGYCPNLDTQFNCKLEDNKPERCRAFELGKDDCIEVRLSHLLPPYREWVYQQWKTQNPQEQNLVE